MKIVFLPEVSCYFLELAEILYDKEYFGYIETAKRYARSLYDDVYTNIPVKSKKLAPTYFTRYGKQMFYSNWFKQKFQELKRATSYLKDPLLSTKMVKAKVLNCNY